MTPLPLLGAMDTFHITVPRVGKVNQIKIEHDGENRQAAWYVNSVTVTAATGRKSVYHVDQWLRLVTRG